MLSSSLLFYAWRGKHLKIVSDAVELRVSIELMGWVLKSLMHSIFSVASLIAQLLATYDISHVCFTTISPRPGVMQDGYQRTWSSKGQVLGQFALPNASEFQLKHTCVSFQYTADVLNVVDIAFSSQYLDF